MCIACALDFAEQRRELFEEHAAEVRVFLVRADDVGRGGERVYKARSGCHCLKAGECNREWHSVLTRKPRPHDAPARVYAKVCEPRLAIGRELGPPVYLWLLPSPRAQDVHDMPKKKQYYKYRAWLLKAP